MKLQRKQIGSTEISYTRIGLGMAALGRPGYINIGHGEDLPGERSKEGMQQHARAVLDAAWHSGIRYFDAARSYGAAEEFLASWLRIRQPCETFSVGSKWGYTYTANWQVEAEKHEIKEHSLATLRRQIGESTRWLGPWLKVYQIHSATLESGVLENTSVLDELARLRDGGLIIGLSLSGPGQSDTLEKALAVRRGEAALFGSVQATWNLHERSVGAMLAEAHGAGWLVIVKEALANGRLTQRGLDVDSQVLGLSHELGEPVDALGLAAVLAQPFTDIVLSGAATIDQLQSNLRANDLVWRDEYDDRLGVMIEPSSKYWSRRSSLAWN